jgi:hypothetical protein
LEKTGGTVVLSGSEPVIRFIGVYSGRLGGDDEFAAQLGRVWKRQLIDEVIDEGVPGAFEIN